MLKKFKKNHRMARECIEAIIGGLSCFGMIFCMYLGLCMLG